MDEFEIKIKLYDLLITHKMTYKELASKTGLSVRTISDLVNNKLKHVPLAALSKVAKAFELEDIRDLIDFKKE